MIEKSLEFLEKYEKALENAGMGFWQLDVATQMLKWDEGLRKLYGLDEGHCHDTLENWYALIHSADRESTKKYITDALTSELEVNSLFRLKMPNQNLKYIRTSAYKVKNEDNKTVTLIGLNWDITIESKLRIDLLKEKRFSENILNAVPDPIFVKDEKHKWIYANTEFEKLLGKDKKEFIGKSDYDFFKKEHADTYWKKDKEVFANDKPNENEEEIVDSNGLPRTILTKKTPFNITPTEKILVGVIRDITELKKIQNSLVQQSKMASLGEMAAGIGHEINNPLAIIQGRSQLLQEKIDAGQVNIANFKNDLQLIEQNCLRISKIIQSLKSVARRSESDPLEASSLLKMIDEVFEISKDRFQKNKLKLFIITDEKINYESLVLARPSEIVQVLVNLLNNAYDAIHNQSSGWVKINLSAVANVYQVSVTDSGADIAPEIAQKMMEPFFTTKVTGKGTGLGLSVSKQIIEDHKGELFYDGKSTNTRFAFNLPRV